MKNALIINWIAFKATQLHLWEPFDYIPNFVAFHNIHQQLQNLSHG